MSFVRQSKYRHIFGTANKLDQCYTGIQVTRSSVDAKFCAVNPKFIAIVLHGQGGGSFLVLPIEKYGRLPKDPPLVNGHRSEVMELSWCPFNDNLLASCSEDCSVKIWEILDGGVTSTQEPWQTLEGHEKRVTLLEWHPTADMILASGGNDNRVIVWNLERGEAAFVLSFPDFPFSISWNHDGSMMATTCKDKTLRVHDVRAESTITEKAKFLDGSKASKCIFLKDGRIFVVGFNRMSQRLYSLWDSKNLDEPLTLEELDTSSGVLHPFYDGDTGVIYLAGKGDTLIRYFEINDQEPYVHGLSQYNGSSGMRGFCWMPKRALDVGKHEIARFYNLHKDNCEPTTFVVPRKSDLFQTDIYPPCASGEASLTADEWIDGRNAPPKTMSMETLFQQGSVTKKAMRPMKSLSKHSNKSDQVSPATSAASLPPNFDLAELCGDMKELKAMVGELNRRVTALEKDKDRSTTGDVVGKNY